MKNSFANLVIALAILIFVGGCETNRTAGPKDVNSLIWRDDPNLKTVLTAYRIDPNKQLEDGNTLFHRACSWGSRFAVKSLLEAGASNEVFNDSGLSPFHLACAAGHVEIVRDLLDGKSVDPFQVTESGLTAMNLAGSPELRTLLSSHSIPVFKPMSLECGDVSLNISSATQESLGPNHGSQYSSKKNLIVVQDPHADVSGHMQVIKGLRSLFEDNPSLARLRVAFLIEGWPALEPISLAPLRSVELYPSEHLMHRIVSSYLISGAIAFVWSSGASVDILGTEDLELYELCRAGVIDHRTKPVGLSAVNHSYVARNEAMALSAEEALKKYDAVFMFIGGGHLMNGATKTDSLIAAAVDDRFRARNSLSIKELFRERLIGYYYFQPEYDEEIRERELYVELFQAQASGVFSDFWKAYSNNYEPGLITVQPNVSRAAKLVGKLKQSSGGGESRPRKPWNTVGKLVDKYKDAISKLNLRGKSLKSGRKAIQKVAPELRETRDSNGRHEWIGKNNQVRVRYDPKGKTVRRHWDKYAPDGTRIDNAGRPGIEHIPAK